jgi:hypothetical protein
VLELCYVGPNNDTRVTIQSERINSRLKSVPTSYAVVMATCGGCRITQQRWLSIRVYDTDGITIFQDIVITHTWCESAPSLTIIFFRARLWLFVDSQDRGVGSILLPLSRFGGSLDSLEPKPVAIGDHPYGGDRSLAISH